MKSFVRTALLGGLILVLGACQQPFGGPSGAALPSPAVGRALAVPVSGVYAGGPVYNNRTVSIPEFKASGFNEVIVWNIFVQANGDLNFNMEFPVVSNGVYTGAAKWPQFASDLASLKVAPTGVNRVTFGIGSSANGVFQAIRDLVNSQGTGPTSLLYKNFQALKTAIPALDAVDLDDENCYDSSSMTAFCVMLGNLGYKVSLCPYTNQSFWTGVASAVNGQRPGTIDRINLQCYDGGAGNVPSSSWGPGGLPVAAGLWDRDLTPAQVQSRLTSWKAAYGITGAWMWLYDDFVGTGKAAQYASAIQASLGSPVIPTAATTPSPATGATGVSTNLVLSWTPGTGASTHDIRFGTTNPPALVVNQTSATYVPGTLAANTLYFWRVDERNAAGTTQGPVWSFTTGSAVPVTPVSLPFNLSNGLTNDGAAFASNGGLDGVGSAFSATLAGTTLTWSGTPFVVGAGGTTNVLKSGGQAVSLPSGKFTTLKFLATAVQGNQASQPFVVTYSDGTTKSFTQGISDWFTPQNYSGEAQAKAFSYRNLSNGGRDNRTFVLYGYALALDKTKSVVSLKVPNNPRVMVFAAALVP